MHLFRKYERVKQIGLSGSNGRGAEDIWSSRVCTGGKEILTGVGRFVF